MRMGKDKINVGLLWNKGRFGIVGNIIVIFLSCFEHDGRRLSNVSLSVALVGMATFKSGCD